MEGDETLPYHMNEWDVIQAEFKKAYTDCHDSSPVSFILLLLASGPMTPTMTHHCMTTCDSS
jgi:hypothetical protein